MVARGSLCSRRWLVAPFVPDRGSWLPLQLVRQIDDEVRQRVAAHVEAFEVQQSEVRARARTRNPHPAPRNPQPQPAPRTPHPRPQR
eukprot:4945694-Prymnesium_polylepis.1